MSVVFKIKNYNDLTRDELFEILRSRSEIFVVEQNCIYLDMDDTDKRSVHVFAEDENKRVIAYLRYFIKEDEPAVVRIGRVMTLKHGTGMGRKLMEAALASIGDFFGKKDLYLEAQVYAVGFYEKFGFSVTSKEFLEDGILHVEMRKHIG